MYCTCLCAHASPIKTNRVMFLGSVYLRNRWVPLWESCLSWNHTIWNLGWFQDRRKRSSCPSWSLVEFVNLHPRLSLSPPEGRPSIKSHHTHSENRLWSPNEPEPTHGFTHPTKTLTYSSGLSVLHQSDDLFITRLVPTTRSVHPGLSLCLLYIGKAVHVFLDVLSLSFSLSL